MRAHRIFYTCLILCAIILGACAIDRATIDPAHRTDYTVYIAAGEALLHHHDIYLAQNIRGWRYVYPPPFAILMVPLARIPLTLGALIWYLLTVAAIGASVIMSAALLGDTPLRRKPHILYGLPLLCLSTLLISGALRSQASPFMFFFMIAAFYYHLKNRPAAAGFSLACAALLKVFPITLIVYFILRRQWRAVLATVIALAVLGIALPSLYWGWQFNLHQYARWFDVVGHPAMMENTDRAQVSSLYRQLLDTTKPRNQSLEALFLSLGLPAHLTHPAVAVCALLMLAALWAAARRIPVPSAPAAPNAPPRPAENLLCGAFIIWSLLITPIAESHYFGALLLPLTLLTGYSIDPARPRQTTRRVVISAAFMVGVLTLTALAHAARWRPLCVASLLIWLLCMRLIWRSRPEAVPGHSLPAPPPS